MGDCSWKPQNPKTPKIWKYIYFTKRFQNSNLLSFFLPFYAISDEDPTFLNTSVKRVWASFLFQFLSIAIESRRMSIASCILFLATKCFAKSYMSWRSGICPASSFLPILSLSSSSRSSTPWCCSTASSLESISNASFYQNGGRSSIFYSTKFSTLCLIWMVLTVSSLSESAQ